MLAVGLSGPENHPVEPALYTQLTLPANRTPGYRVLPWNLLSLPTTHSPTPRTPTISLHKAKILLPSWVSLDWLRIQPDRQDHAKGLLKP